MHPTLMQDIARSRHADLLREAQRARVALELGADSDSDEQPRLRLNSSWRRRLATTVGRPALGH